MKNIINILILTVLFSFCLNAQTLFNAPVSKSTTLSTLIIKPLSVSPQSSQDWLNWPSVPIGSKYVLNSQDNEDSDFKTIFTLNGQPNVSVEISMVCQNIVDNVEISFQMKGTQVQYLGNNPVPELNFDGNGKAVVSLNSDGNFYMHIVYNWVWAKENSTPGIKSFTQLISAQYFGI